MSETKEGTTTQVGSTLTSYVVYHDRGGLTIRPTGRDDVAGDRCVAPVGGERGAVTNL